MQPRSELDKFPDEVLIRAIDPKRGHGEQSRAYYKRLTKTASVNKRLANLLRPTLYRNVEIPLGFNINPERNPADERIRHLRRCRKTLTETRTLSFFGIINWSSHEVNVYQTVSTDQVARAVSYTKYCKYLKLTCVELLDPQGEHASGRRMEEAQEHPELLCSTDDEDEEDDGEWKGMGEEARRERSERRRARREKEDEEDGPDAPLPADMHPVQALTIENTYHTTPNAILSLISRLPNLNRVYLDTVEWKSNTPTAVTPHPSPHQRIEHLACIDVEPDLHNPPHDMTAEIKPFFPILANAALIRHVRTLALGFEDPNKINEANIRGWAAIPLLNYTALEELTLSTVIRYRLFDNTAEALSQAAAALLRRAPAEMQHLQLKIVMEASTGHYGFHHIEQEDWECIRDAIPGHLHKLSITFVLETLVPFTAAHENLIHAVFSNARIQPRVYHTNRQMEVAGTKASKE